MKLTHTLAESAIGLLKLHRLPPDPRNFTLAYWISEASHSALAAEVHQIMDGGVRLSQAQADQLFTRYIGAIGASAATSSTGFDLADIRHQTRRLGDIAADMSMANSSFNLDLRASVDQLDKGAVNVAALIAAMIARSEHAESELAATAQQVEALRQELDTARDDANKDALTGLPNRRALNAHLEQLARARKPRLIAIADIDRFKSINDQYSHAVGDRVLKTVANALAESCAPHFVGRWGGEEFLIILPEVALEDGATILDQSRKTLRQRPFKLRETDEPMGAITFSAGVTSASGDSSENAAALERADLLLYRAKAEGRDKVIAA